MSDRKRNATARGALGYSANASVLFFFLGIGAVGVLVKALHVSMYGPQGALIAIGYIAVGVVCLLAPSVVRRRVRRARLAKLEFPFDVDVYLDALNQRSVHGALEVEVELGDSAVPDATTLTMPTTSSVRSSAGKLVLVSPAMRTTRQSYPSGAYFYNGDLDRWFARACGGLLRQLHARHRITAVRVRYVPDLHKEIDAGERAKPASETVR